jgi:hypothetical protein
MDGHAGIVFAFLDDEENKHIGLVMEGGDAMDLGAYVDDELTDLFVGGDYNWVSAAEPSRAMAPEMTLDGPIALAVGGSSPRVQDAVWHNADENNMLGSSDDFSAVSWTALSAGPGARTDFVPVYSRASQRLFLVGGVSGTTPTGEIWMRPIASGGSEAWQQVDLMGTYQPDQVLAATYSFYDHRLWILDDIGEAVRLTRVHVETGYNQIMAEWERDSDWDRQWLRLDQDGRVLLFSSNSSSHVHYVARLAVAPFVSGAPLVVEALTGREGALAYRPIVDMAGYTFIRDDDVVERVDSLDGDPADVEDLADIL